MDFFKKHFKLIALGILVLVFSSMLVSCIGCMNRPRVERVYVGQQGGDYDGDQGYYDDGHGSHRRGYHGKRNRYNERRAMPERRKIKVKSRRLKNPFRSLRRSRGGRR